MNKFKYLILLLSGTALTVSVLSLIESKENKRRIGTLTRIIDHNTIDTADIDDLDDLDEYITEEEQTISESSNVDDTDEVLKEEAPSSIENSTGGIDYVEENQDEGEKNLE